MGRLFLFAEPNEDCVTPKASLYTHTHTPRTSRCVSPSSLSLVMFFFPPSQKKNHYYCSVLISRLFIFPALISENRKRRFCRTSQTKQNRKDVTQRFWKPDFNPPRRAVAFEKPGMAALYARISVTLNPPHLAAFCLSAQR